MWVLRGSPPNFQILKIFVITLLKPTYFDYFDRIMAYADGMTARIPIFRIFRSANWNKIR